MRWYTQAARPSPLDPPRTSEGPLSADDSGAAVAPESLPIGPPGRIANRFWPAKTDNDTTLSPTPQTDEAYALPLGPPTDWGYRSNAMPEYAMEQQGFDASNAWTDVQAAPKVTGENPPDMKPAYSLFAARPARYFLTSYRSPGQRAAQDAMLGSKAWQDPSAQTPFGVEMDSEGFRRNRDRSEPSFYGDYVPRSDDGIQFPALY